MCTLAAFLGESKRYPLVIAANRDEFLRRPTLPPAKIRDSPWIVAGLDLEAGGTWLGLNEHDLVVGLLNRRTNRAPDPARRSRGLLCLEALGCRSTKEARALVEATPPSECNPYNLLVASPDDAFVAQNREEEVRITPLPSGVHVLTNLDLNDPMCPRIAKSHHLFRDAAEGLDRATVPSLASTVHNVLSDHSTPLDPRAAEPPDNLCVHLGAYGTRSSSLLIYDAQRSAFHFHHADGPPCTTAYREVILPGA